jgi:hypothetical protein
MVEVIGTDEFTSWFDGLDDQATKSVVHGVDLLAQLGLALGHPYSSAINGASIPLRELRIQAGGRPLRVFYAFDPARQAVLLIGGDKTGEKRFYESMIPIAERLWKEYLNETAQVE